MVLIYPPPSRISRDKPIFSGWTRRATRGPRQQSAVASCSPISGSSLSAFQPFSFLPHPHEGVSALTGANSLRRKHDIRMDPARGRPPRTQKRTRLWVDPFTSFQLFSVSASPFGLALGSFPESIESENRHRHGRLCAPVDRCSELPGSGAFFRHRGRHLAPRSPLWALPTIRE